MIKKTVSRSFVVFFVLIIAVSALFAGYAAANARRILYGQARADLRTIVSILAAAFEAKYACFPAEADRFCKEAGTGTEARITIILPDGRVLGDSEADVSLMNNHGDRPEIRQALQNGEGWSIRWSVTVNRAFLYLARVFPSTADPHFVMRASLPIEEITLPIRRQLVVFLGIGLCAILLAWLWTRTVVMRIVKPLERMNEQAAEYANGNLLAPPPDNLPKAFMPLSAAMTRMAGELNRRMEELRTRKEDLSAILSGMSEAVVVLDEGLSVSDVNPSACALAGVSAAEARGQSLIRLFRNVRLAEFARQVSSGTLPSPPADFQAAPPPETEVELTGTRKVSLQVHAARIAGNRVVLVMNDITRIKHLEQVRRDFVANVSHELKTPITSIKGFVETLQDGAIENPADARRFLDIVGRQTHQLSAIIDDLLLLSLLEQQDAPEPEMAPCGLDGILDNAISAVGEKAKRRGNPISREGSSGVVVRGNGALLGQLFVNLLDNAIKYSEPGGPITVDTAVIGGSVRVSVMDKGCGIPKEDQGRIFERFYRVDKARSRELGGTGLGLAIVKHIASFHGAEVGLESAPGLGSVFSILLPLSRSISS